MGAEFRIEGLDDLNKQLESIATSLDADAVEPILFEGAQTIAGDMLQRAPRGPTGNLKRSIGAKTLRRRDKNPAPSIAAVDRKIAPHAHLVEFGTSKMSARPFMRPAVDSQGGKVAKQVEEGLQRLIGEAAK